MYVQIQKRVFYTTFFCKSDRMYLRCANRIIQSEQILLFYGKTDFLIQSRASNQSRFFLRNYLIWFLIGFDAQLFFKKLISERL